VLTPRLTATRQRSTNPLNASGHHHTNEAGYHGTSNNVESWSIANQHIEGINSPSGLVILVPRNQAKPIATDKWVPCYQ
jgi:hypothetical protein